MITSQFQKESGENPEMPLFGLEQITMLDFRNYREGEVVFDRGFNVVSGANAQGKTNLLEAVYLLSTTRLLRGQRDAEAVRTGAGKARVEGHLLESPTLLAVELTPGVRKRVLLNNLSLPRAADLIGRLPSVCVSAQDMEIIRGEPADRRLFLDLELSALYPAYLRHLTLYKRALDQRNALLKDSREWPQAAETFEVWEVQLAEHGCAIREVRQRYLGKLEPSLTEAHAFIGDGESLTCRYEARDECVNVDDVSRLLTSTRVADIARGSTSIGPHRDELLFEVDGKDARLYGSQGQQRTAVIALKMATLEVDRQELGAIPMLLLDDIFSDLDAKRRERLVKWVLDRAGQTVLTCTEASAAGPEILDLARVFNVVAGEIRPS